jgi:hypothetical protein
MDWLPRVTVDTERLRNWANPLISLDSPEQLSGDQMAADIAAGFTPGVGTVQGARDLVRGLRAGDPVEAGLGALGMIPMVGGMTKGGRALVQALRGKAGDVKVQNVRGDAPTEVTPVKMTKQAAEEANYPLEASVSPYGSVKLERPLGEVTREVERIADEVPERIVRLEDLENARLIAAPGDTSDVNFLLRALRGEEIAPVQLHGGYGYSRYNPEYAWASDPAVLERMAKEAHAAREAGQTPILAYTKMGPASNDFNTMMSETVMKLINKNPKLISNADAKEFDDALRAYTEKDPKTGEQVRVFANWLGIKNPNAAEQLDNVAGAKRRAFIQMMEKKTWRDRGFPDISEVRQAQSAPELLDVPNYSTGAALMRVDPGEIVRDTIHPTYPASIPGEYVGRLETAPDFRDVFADWSGMRRAAGKAEGSDFRSFMMGLPSQTMTPELISALRAKGYQ